jgi:hypothetical protein
MQEWFWLKLTHNSGEIFFKDCFQYINKYKMIFRIVAPSDPEYHDFYNIKSAPSKEAFL